MKKVLTYSVSFLGNCWAHPARIRLMARSPGVVAVPSSCARPSHARVRNSSPTAMMKYLNLSSRPPRRRRAHAPRPASASVRAMRIASPVSSSCATFLSPTHCLPTLRLSHSLSQCWLTPKLSLKFNQGVGLSFGLHTQRAMFSTVSWPRPHTDTHTHSQRN